MGGFSFLNVQKSSSYLNIVFILILSTCTKFIPEMTSGMDLASWHDASISQHFCICINKGEADRSSAERGLGREMRVGSAAEKVLLEDPVPGQGKSVLCSTFVLLRFAAQRRAQLRPGKGRRSRSKWLLSLSLMKSTGQMESMVVVMMNSYYTELSLHWQLSLFW